MLKELLLKVMTLPAISFFTLATPTNQRDRRNGVLAERVAVVNRRIKSTDVPVCDEISTTKRIDEPPAEVHLSARERSPVSWIGQALRRLSWPICLIVGLQNLLYAEDILYLPQKNFRSGFTQLHIKIR